ncbi:MAG: copper resistance protein CopC [Gemmatimonadota bacterium]
MTTALAAFPRAAAAHAVLRRSAPSADARLDTIPTLLRFEFSERVETRFTRLLLTNARGDTIALGAVTFGDDGHAVILAAIRSTLGPGRYSVRWQTAGADGHPSRGQFAFTVNTSAVLPPPVPSTAVTLPNTSFADSSTGKGGGPDAVAATNAEVALFDQRSFFYVVIRWAQYVAAFLVVGALVFGRFVLQPLTGRLADPHTLLAGTRTRTQRIGAAASISLVIVQIGRMLAQRVTLQGGGDFKMEVSFGELLIGTAWGTGLLLTLAGAVVAAVGFLSAEKSKAFQTPLLVIAVSAVSVGFGLSGHQAGSDFSPSLAVGLDAIHNLSAASWLGTVALLALVALPLARRDPSTDHSTVAAILRVFSPVMLVSAGLAGVTGLVLATLNLGSISALWQTEYGRVLLIKLAILSLVAATGAFNWKRVLPTAGTPSSTRLLQRTAGAEALVALAALAVVAVLVATPMPSMR